MMPVTQAKCPKFDGTVVAIRSGANRILLPSAGANREQMEAFLADPDGCMARGAVCKSGSRGYAVVVELAGLDCFVKHYRRLGFIYVLKNLFRTARAVRTWNVSWKLLKLGIRVPRPIFCIESRRFRLLGDAYLATEFVANGIDLRKFWRGATEEERLVALIKCAEIIGALHAAGWSHGDLKWQNILVVANSADPEIVLVDVDAARRHFWGIKRHALNDVNRFLCDMKEGVGASSSLIKVFTDTRDNRVSNVGTRKQ